MQVPGFIFNANQYEPSQGIGVHPPAQKIPFQITNTEMKETADKTGGMLVVEFSSPAGTLIHRYNIKNNSPKAVEIAYGQLSALCRATGIYNIDGNNECAALRGGKGLMDVGYQKGEEPGAANPEAKGYTELKRVYDLAGNDPAKSGQAQPQGQTQQPQGGPTPQTAQPGGAWGTGNTQPSQEQPQGQTSPNPAGGAWQPGNQPPNPNPPWGSR